MAYNIDTWNTKELRGFTISYIALISALESKDHEPEIEGGGSTASISMGELSIISGTLHGDKLMVNDIKVLGEGSGRLMIDVLDPVFADSTGILEASRVWEGGDHIDRVRFENGVKTETPIEV